MAGDNKTEKATPKRREEARNKGQVARSSDLSGSVVLFAAILALAATAPNIMEALGRTIRETLALASDSDVAVGTGLGTLLGGLGVTFLKALAPIAGAAILGAVIVNLAQVRPKLTPKALKPDPKRINPLQGFKNVFGPNALFEGVKSIVKMGLLGAIALIAVLPSIPEMAGLVGMAPAALLAKAAEMVLGIAIRGCIAYMAIGAVDYVWQRYRHEKNLKMDMDEVKRESKDQNISAEVKGAMRRRQMQASRARMMAAVPTADVVVTNPTHFSVALKYDSGMHAPEVVAKGQDLIALQIRRVAKEHGVPIIPEPPLARSLHSSVEIGQAIPEELFAAVAQVLAFVYRTAGRKAG
jgi:flagellar biosynthetic protein FlhB